jgi:hypothetical protein
MPLTLGVRYASSGIEQAEASSAEYVSDTPFAAQPALRGVVTLRGPGAVLVVRFHGCAWVRGGGGVRCEGASSGGAVGSAAPACCSRDARSASSSLARQQCLYFLPEPQWHGSLRPWCFAAASAIPRPLLDYNLITVSLRNRSSEVTFCREATLGPCRVEA